MRPVIIEARLNEVREAAANPRLPVTPDEIVADALACARAGAAAVHFHARGPDGRPSQDPALYAGIIRRIRAESDVIIHPTLGYTSGASGAEARFAPIRALAARPETRPDLVPLDMGSANIDAWDAASRRFLSRGAIYRNPTDELAELAGATRALGLRPYCVAWTVGFTRLVEQFLEAGLLADDPLLLCLTMTEGRIRSAHPGTLAGLRAHLDFLPRAARIEWFACLVGGSLLPLLDEVLARGGHPSLGLGDHDYPELGAPDNAALVAHVGARVRAAGLRVAGAAEARAMLALSEGAAVP